MYDYSGYSFTFHSLKEHKTRALQDKCAYTCVMGGFREGGGGGKRTS